MDLWQLTASEAGARMADGTLSSDDYTRACLARIVDREPLVKAWAHRRLVLATGSLDAAPCMACLLV